MMVLGDECVLDFGIVADFGSVGDELSLVRESQPAPTRPPPFALSMLDWIGCGVDRSCGLQHDDDDDVGLGQQPDGHTTSAELAEVMAFLLSTRTERDRAREEAASAAKQRQTVEALLAVAKAEAAAAEERERNAHMTIHSLLRQRESLAAEEAVQWQQVANWQKVAASSPVPSTKAPGWMHAPDWPAPKPPRAHPYPVDAEGTTTVSPLDVPPPSTLDETPADRDPTLSDDSCGGGNGGGGNGDGALGVAAFDGLVAPDFLGCNGARAPLMGDVLAGTGTARAHGPGAYCSRAPLSALKTDDDDELQLVNEASEATMPACARAADGVGDAEKESRRESAGLQLEWLERETALVENDPAEVTDKLILEQMAATTPAEPMEAVHSPPLSRSASLGSLIRSPFRSPIGSPIGSPRRRPHEHPDDDGLSLARSSSLTTLKAAGYTGRRASASMVRVPPRARAPPTRSPSLLLAHVSRSSSARRPNLAARSRAPFASVARRRATPHA